MITPRYTFCDKMFLTVDKIKFSTWLMQEREKQGLSQSDLARASGLHRAVISKLENGTQPMPDTIKALAPALKYPVEYLYEIAGILEPKIELSPIKRKLAHLAEDLPDSDVEIAIALLEQRSEYYKKHPNTKPAK